LNASENRLRVDEKVHNAANPLLEFFVLRADIFERVKEGKKIVRIVRKHLTTSLSRSSVNCLAANSGFKSFRYRK